MTSPLLRKLVDFTHTHFTDEEAMMAAANYPGLAEHKIKHRELMKQVEQYAARHERGEITVNLQLMNFLRDWFTTHILKEDMQFGLWLNMNGKR